MPSAGAFLWFEPDGVGRHDDVGRRYEVSVFDRVGEKVFVVEVVSVVFAVLLALAVSGWQAS